MDRRRLSTSARKVGGRWNQSIDEQRTGDDGIAGCWHGKLSRSMGSSSGITAVVAPRLLCGRCVVGCFVRDTKCHGLARWLQPDARRTFMV